MPAPDAAPAWNWLIIMVSLLSAMMSSGRQAVSSGQAKFLAPMAISIIFGLTVSTVLTLIIIPCSYAIVDEWRQAIRSFVGLQRDAFVRDVPESKLRASH